MSSGRDVMMDNWRDQVEPVEQTIRKSQEDQMEQVRLDERNACANLREEIILYGAPNKYYEYGFWEGLAAYEAAIKARSHK